MRFHIHKVLRLVVAAAAMSLSVSFAAPYAVSSKIEPFTAKDQHEQSFTFDPASTDFLLVSHDMETGKKANSVLNGLGKEYLSNKKVIYIANIYGMPAIGRVFALPKMKKYAHRIILGDDAGLIAKFPEQKGKVTVISLSGGNVKSISYWTPGSEPFDDIFK